MVEKWNDLIYWAKKSKRNKGIAFFSGVAVFFVTVWLVIQILDLF